VKGNDGRQVLLQGFFVLSKTGSGEDCRGDEQERKTTS
jgi:hypothetical protein